MILIIALSILFQLSATVLALRLIAVTRRTAAWLLLAAAIGLMTVRRVESLIHVLSGSVNGYDPVFETVGLVLSALMFAGIYAIRPLFEEIVSIGERHRSMSEQLQALSAEQELLLLHTRDFIYRHDPSGMITFVSPAVEQITGYSPEEWHTHYAAHYTDNSANRAGINSTNQMLSSGRPGPPYRIEVHRKGGGSVWLEINKQPYVADGRIVAFIGVARDISKRVALEEEREKLIDELKTAVNNIKRLRGLLPICASCKKIRDDHGYWQQIESYVSEHSEAEFSHGLCPDCAKRLYPDLKNPPL